MLTDPLSESFPLLQPSNCQGLSAGQLQSFQARASQNQFGCSLSSIKDHKMEKASGFRDSSSTMSESRLSQRQSDVSRATIVL